MYSSFFAQASGGSENYQQSIEKIQSLPSFFKDSIDWGVDASAGALGFMCLLVLSVQLFKR